MVRPMLVHIIEENIDVRQMLAALLGRNGIEVQVFDHAAHYLDATNESGFTAPAALLADLRHSSLIFPEETEKLCRLFSNLPWLLMSSVPTVQPLLQHPVAMPKPFAPAKLEMLLAGLRQQPKPQGVGMSHRIWRPKLASRLLPAFG